MAFPAGSGQWALFACGRLWWLGIEVWAWKRKLILFCSIQQNGMVGWGRLGSIIGSRRRVCVYAPWDEWGLAVIELSYISRKPLSLPSPFSLGFFCLCLYGCASWTIERDTTVWLWLWSSGRGLDSGVHWSGWVWLGWHGSLWCCEGWGCSASKAKRAYTIAREGRTGLCSYGSHRPGTLAFPG